METVSHKGMVFRLLYSKAQINEVVLRLGVEINNHYSLLKEER